MTISIAAIGACAGSHSQGPQYVGAGSTEPGYHQGHVTAAEQSLRAWVMAEDAPNAGDEAESDDAAADHRDTNCMFASCAAPLEAETPTETRTWIPLKQSWVCQHRPVACPRGYWRLPDGAAEPSL
jgi:hypothetical protein